MKSVITILAVLAALSGKAAVTCKKEGRFYYPNDEKSKKIAEMLKVKTCNGKRFKEVLAKLGETSNVPKTVSNLSVDEIANLVK